MDLLKIGQLVLPAVQYFICQENITAYNVLVNYGMVLKTCDSHSLLGIDNTFNDQSYQQCVYIEILRLGGVLLFIVSWPALGLACTLLSLNMWEMYLSHLWMGLEFSDCINNINWLWFWSELLSLSTTSCAHAKRLIQAFICTYMSHTFKSCTLDSI